MRIVTDILALVVLWISYTVTCLPLFLKPERPNHLGEIRKTNALLLDRWQSEYPTRSKTNPLTVPLPSLLDPIATYKTPEAGYIDELYGDPKKQQRRLAEILGITGVFADASRDEKGKTAAGERRRAKFAEDTGYVGVPSTTPPIWSTEGKMDGLWPIPRCRSDGGSCWRGFIGWCKSVWKCAWSGIKDLFKPRRETAVAASGTVSPRYHDYGGEGRHDWYCCEDCWGSRTGCVGSCETYW